MILKLDRLRVYVAVEGDSDNAKLFQCKWVVVCYRNIVMGSRKRSTGWNNLMNLLIIACMWQSCMASLAITTLLPSYSTLYSLYRSIVR